MDSAYCHLERWCLNNRTVNIEKHIIEDPEDKLLFDTITKRPAFSYTDQTVTIPTIYASLAGVKGDIEDYNIFLFDLNEKLSNLDLLYKKIDTPLDKRFRPDLLKKLQESWGPYQRVQEAKTSEIIKFFIKKNTIKKPSDRNLQSLLTSALENTIDYYKGQKDYRLTELKNILFHIIHWYNMYCTDFLNNFDFTNINPTALLFGEINKRELYFTVFLRYLGCDVICINGVQNPILDEFAKKEDYVSSFIFPRQIELTGYPAQRPKKQMETAAKQCSDELRDTLHSDDSFCYRPWQFINYNVLPLTMRTTIDEVVILGVEKAMVRQGWEAQAGQVSIPHFFTKINGIYSDHNRYWKVYNKIRASSKILICEQSTLVPSQISLMKNEYYMILDRKSNVIDDERLKKASFWPYMQYRDHIQNLIVDKCKSLCTLENFKRIPGTPPEMQKIEIFSRMMQLPNTILNLLQTFDYPNEVPKLLIYNSRDNYVMSQDDAIIIAFAASAAVDVIIFNTTGQKDIEIYLEEKDVDIHHLEGIVINVNPKTHSIMGKYF